MPEENLPLERVLSSEASPVEVLPVRQMKILFSWKAPLRPFKRRDREFWTTVIAIIFLVGMILFFVKEWLLIAAMVALAFVYYVLSTVPPEEIEYRITNRGITFADKSYDWDYLWRFWFSDKYSDRLLNIDTKLTLPGRLSFVIKKEEEKTIEEIMEKYLLHEEAEPTFFDKASSWLAKKIPLELEEKKESTVPPSLPITSKP